jgi:hypothetical protein
LAFGVSEASLSVIQSRHKDHYSTIEIFTSSMSSTASTATPTPSVNVKRCPTCETDRPLDWFQTNGTGTHGLVDGMTKGCKQCRVRSPSSKSSCQLLRYLQEKKAAYMKSYRKKKAATKASEPRPKLKHQLAANDSTPNLPVKPSTTAETQTTSAQKIDKEMPNPSKATRLLDQDEIIAAADRLLDLVIDLQDSDDSEAEGEHRTCED